MIHNPYDIRKILNEKDIDGEEPSIFLIETNRSTGKTTSLLEYVTDNAIQKNEQFMCLFRTKSELKGSEIIFDGINSIFYNNELEIEGSFKIQDLIYEIKIKKNDVPIVAGVCVCLKDRNALKKYSPSFSNITTIFMDEFQSEDGKYLSDEVEKFYSIFISVARGNGNAFRKNVKAVFLANNITIMNPWYLYFKVHKYIKGNNQLIRGKGWICHRWINKNVAETIETSSIVKAMGTENRSVAMSVGHEMLYDCTKFIKPTPKKTIYLLSIRVKSGELGVRIGKADGYFYIDHKPEKDYPFAVTNLIELQDNKFILMKKSDKRFKALLDAFNASEMFYCDVEAKNSMLEFFNLKFISG